MEENFTWCISAKNDINNIYILCLFPRCKKLTLADTCLYIYITYDKDVSYRLKTRILGLIMRGMKYVKGSNSNLAPTPSMEIHLLLLKLADQKYFWNVHEISALIN